MAEDKFFKVRLREDVHERLMHWAELNRRSMTQEIVGRLEASIDSPTGASRTPIEVTAKTLERLKACADYFGRDVEVMMIEALRSGILDMERQIEHERESERNSKIWALDLSDEEIDNVTKFVKEFRASQKSSAPAKKTKTKK